MWLGTDEVLGRPVALKRLAPTLGSQARAEREARLAARLNHPHVVAVFDLIQDEDDEWLVMEYVEGSTLAATVLADGPLSPDQAAPILAQVADALAAAHAAGIVHRDVKPSNILIDLEGAAKLTDFGVARSADVDATLTQTGFLTGSPAYLAPEVAAGGPAGPPSDVWSLGATAFHALTGRPPYEVADNVMGTLYRIVHDDPPRTERAGWLAPLVAGTMTQDPQQRWTLPQVQAFLAGNASAGRAGAGRAGAPEHTLTLPALAAVAPPAPPAPPGPASGPPGGPPSGPPLGAVPSAAAVARPGGRVAGRQERRRTWLWPAALGGLLAALVVVLAVTHPWSGGGSGTANDAGSSGHASTRPSHSPSSSAPASPSPAAGPSEDGIRAFLSTYLDTASSDPAKAFSMLTPHYQRASGGLKGYEGFWGNVRKIHDVGDVAPSLDPLGVSYRYTYTLRGAGKRTEDVQLRLVYTDGRYLIDAS